MKRKFLRSISYLTVGVLSLALLAGIAAGVGYLVLAPQLPAVDVLKDVDYQVPLRVYTQDGGLIAEFGQKKRAPLSYGEIPPTLVSAFVAAEDERFFEHPGVDYQGLLRAVWYLVRTGEKGPGGSTITMQVARNFFLSREKTYLRKANEILLALKIDRELSKREIMELYLNKIYLGNRAYGVGAAAQVYYGKPASELTLPQMAMIAGLPKAPSRDNPVANPQRAEVRRGYVLRRMRELGFIDQPTYEEALAAPLTARTYVEEPEVDAPYVAEMVRTQMVERFGEERAYSAGFRVYTTLQTDRQQAAVAALREALLAYDRRHGYRGAVARVDLQQVTDRNERLERLRRHSVAGGLQPALVLAVNEEGAQVLLRRGEQAELPWAGMQWAKPFINREVVGKAPQRPADVLAPGDVIRVQPTADGLMLAQLPEVSGALVALDPKSGGIVSLVGGFDFFDSKFNRATQALRQPGSNFKPFIYSAALEAGLTPASLINDAPVVFHDDALESTWRPENYSGRFYGPTRLREALVRSRNLVSIRVLRRIGVDYAIDYATRFGFPQTRLPRNLSLSLGSASLTPLEVASGYAVFANGGHRVEPYVVDRVVASDGRVVYRAPSVVLCDDCETALAEEESDSLERVGLVTTAASDPVVPPRELVAARRVITAQNAYLMTDMMRDVVRRGTARRALQLGRSDLAGKTGTTNDQRDAWFSGFNGALVATAWVGFDQVQPLGRGETGSSAALPMWVSYMEKALEGVPETVLKEPDGLVTVRIDAETGEAATADHPNAVFETFRADNVPESRPTPVGGAGGGSNAEQPLF